MPINWKIIINNSKLLPIHPDNQKQFNIQYEISPKPGYVVLKIILF